MGWEEEVARSLWPHQEWLELSLVNRMCKERHCHSNWLLQKESRSPNTLNFCPTPLLEGSAFSHFMRIFPIFFSLLWFVFSFEDSRSRDWLSWDTRQSAHLEKESFSGWRSSYLWTKRMLPETSYQVLPLHEPTECMCCCPTPLKINHFREHKKQWIF